MEKEIVFEFAEPYSEKVKITLSSGETDNEIIGKMGYYGPIFFEGYLNDLFENPQILKEALEDEGFEIESLSKVDKEREAFKAELKELLEEDEMMAIGDDNEVIYEIDDIKIYGGFEYGSRGVDHNILLSKDVDWEDIIKWGTVVVPETMTYISDEAIDKYEEMGYENLPTDNNHIMGTSDSQSITKDLELPSVQFEWSESDDVPTDESFTISEADRLLTNLNELAKEEKGYFKTKFNIIYQLDDQEQIYTGRYDIGDEQDGLIESIETKTNNLFENDDFYNIDQKEAYEKIKDEAIPTFKQSLEESDDAITKKYPKNSEEVRYCELTGEPFTNLEPYFYVDGGTVLSEEAHSVLYTEKEWKNIYDNDSDDNYWTEEIYDLPESELTNVKPKPLYNDVYYRCNPNDQSKIEKLGTISDIVSNASKQTDFDLLSVNKEFITDLSINKNKNKHEFNKAMEKYSVLKNLNNDELIQSYDELSNDKNKVYWYEANQRYVGDSGASPEYGRVAIENTHTGSKGYKFGAVAYAYKLDKEDVEGYALRGVKQVRELYGYEEQELKDWNNRENDYNNRENTELER